MDDPIDINEEMLAFNHAIGNAITQWAHVELALLGIVHACFDNKDISLHGRAFFAVENFRAKLQVVDSVVAGKFAGTVHLGDWPTLMERAQTESKARNKLAHHWKLTDPSKKSGRRVMLLPFRINPKPGKSHPDALCVRDIVAFGLRFSALMCALENFQCRLLGQPERFPKSQEQPKGPPTIAALRREIYAYARRPPRPLRR